MDLEFSIVLFENEGYATARGDKGVQDILAAKTDSGYIKEGTFPIIITLYQSCWKWWISPKHQEIDFLCSLLIPGLTDLYGRTNLSNKE